MQKRYPILFQIDHFMRSSGSLAYSIATTTNNASTISAAPIQISVTAAIAQVYYIHTDHLDTPRIITNSANAKVWEWNNDDPFANNVPNENPSNLGTFVYNPRLPGQYFDSETNTNYNYYRDYDPSTGRYVESDPIGLEGGTNTYGYVGGNPIGARDPRGLAYRGPWALFGHGDLLLQNGANLEGALVDTPTSDINKGKPVLPGMQIPSGADVDFFRANGEWYKLKNGAVSIKPDPKDSCKVIIECAGMEHGGSCDYYPVRKPHWPWNSKEKTDEAIEYLNRSKDTGLPGLPLK
jgi:RHS repeat-associated protein